MRNLNRLARHITIEIVEFLQVGDWVLVNSCKHPAQSEFVEIMAIGMVIDERIKKIQFTCQNWTDKNDIILRYLPLSRVMVGLNA